MSETGYAVVMFHVEPEIGRDRRGNYEEVLRGYECLRIGDQCPLAGATTLAMVVNENACSLGEHSVLETIAKVLAPTGVCEVMPWA